jgi:hypothetical protein
MPKLAVAHFRSPSGRFVARAFLGGATVWAADLSEARRFTTERDAICAAARETDTALAHFEYEFRSYPDVRIRRELISYSTLSI